MSMKPSVGRIVHYNDDPYPPSKGEPDNWIAALVLHVHDTEFEKGTVVNLKTYDRDGNEAFRDMVRQGTLRYQWRWPPRVE